MVKWALSYCAGKKWYNGIILSHLINCAQTYTLSVFKWAILQVGIYPPDIFTYIGKMYWQNYSLQRCLKQQGFWLAVEKGLNKSWYSHSFNTSRLVRGKNPTKMLFCVLRWKLYDVHRLSFMWRGRLCVCLYMQRPETHRYTKKAICLRRQEQGE